MKRIVKVKDILPLVKWNDVRLVLGEEDEICLLRKEFITETLSDNILEMTVTGIENDESILDTVNIYVFGYKTRIKFMHFTVIQIIIMFLIGYICLYTLVDRVMKCIEHCATARAYGRFREAGVMTKMDDVAAGIAKSKEEKDHVEKRLD